MEQFGKFIASVMILVFSTILFGFTFSILWGWFISPTFNVAEITIIQGIGIGSVKSYLFFRKNRKEDEKLTFKSILKVLGNRVAISLTALGTGWIYHLFM